MRRSSSPTPSCSATAFASSWLETEPTPRWIVIAAEPITDIDTTAADMLVKLDEELNADGIHLVFAELKDPVRDKIERYSLYETIDPNHFYPTIKTAIKAFRAEASAEPIPPGRLAVPRPAQGTLPRARQTRHAGSSAERRGNRTSPPHRQRCLTGRHRSRSSPSFARSAIGIRVFVHEPAQNHPVRGWPRRRMMSILDTNHISRGVQSMTTIIRIRSHRHRRRRRRPRHLSCPIRR